MFTMCDGSLLLHDLSEYQNQVPSFTIATRHLCRAWRKYPLGSNYRGRESPAISLNRKPELALDYFTIGSQALDIHHKITGIIRSIVAY